LLQFVSEIELGRVALQDFDADFTDISAESIIEVIREKAQARGIEIRSCAWGFISIASVKHGPTMDFYGYYIEHTNREIIYPGGLAIGKEFRKGLTLYSVYSAKGTVPLLGLSLYQHFFPQEKPGVICPQPRIEFLSLIPQGDPYCDDKIDCPWSDTEDDSDSDNE